MDTEKVEKLYANVLEQVLRAGYSNLQLVAVIYDDQGNVLMRQKKKNTFGAFIFYQLADGKVRACMCNHGKVDGLRGMSNIIDWCKAEIMEILPCLLFGKNCNVKGVVKYKIENSHLCGFISVSGAATAERDLKAIIDGLRAYPQDSNGVYILSNE